MIKPKKKRPRGRPRAKDPKIHLPRVKVRGSLLEKLLDHSRANNKYLSHVVEKALKIYLDMHSPK